MACSQIKRAHTDYELAARAHGTLISPPATIHRNEKLFTSEQLLAFDTRIMQHAAKELRAVK